MILRVSGGARLIAGEFTLSLPPEPSLVPSVFATWDAANKYPTIMLSNSDLTANNSAGSAPPAPGSRSTIVNSTNKWYWEVIYEGNYPAIGVCNSSWDFDGSLISSPDPNDRLYYSVSGNLLGNALDGAHNAAFGDSYSGGDVVSVAIDYDAGKIWWAKNGVWQGAGSPDPATGTDPGDTFTPNTALYPAFWIITASGQITANFGGSAFAYTVPTGFVQGFGTL